LGQCAVTFNPQQRLRCQQRDEQQANENYYREISDKGISAAITERSSQRGPIWS